MSPNSRIKLLHTWINLYVVCLLDHIFTSILSRSFDCHYYLHLEACICISSSFSFFCFSFLSFLCYFSLSSRSFTFFVLVLRYCFSVFFSSTFPFHTPQLTYFQTKLLPTYYLSIPIIIFFFIFILFYRTYFAPSCSILWLSLICIHFCMFLFFNFFEWFSFLSSVYLQN